MAKYMNAEEAAYRKVQRTLKEATEGGRDEYSAYGDGTDGKKFKLPKSLRGWLFMECSLIPLKAHSGIFHQTQGLNIDHLKRIMTESYPDKVLKDLDSRTATKAPWQRNERTSSFKQTPFKRFNRTRSAKMVDEEDDDYDDDYDDDNISAADDDYDDDYDYGDEDEDDDDPDQVAHVDAEG